MISLEYDIRGSNDSLDIIFKRHNTNLKEALSSKKGDWKRNKE